MNEKKAYEAFRVRKFAQPHSALLQGDDAEPPESDAAVQPQELLDDEDPDLPDENGLIANDKKLINQVQRRVILHFDCDCFYAQVEEVRNPELRKVPLGVTQKYLIVTCNYLARAAGVTKLMGIRDAMAKCPSLVLVSGEDLGPYRQASKSIHAVLSRYGPAEKLGMDETFVDVTEEVLRRIRSGVYEPPAAPPRFVGHLHTAACAIAADTRYRPQDLRAVPAHAASAAPGAAPSPHNGGSVAALLSTAADTVASEGSGGGGDGNSGSSCAPRPRLGPSSGGGQLVIGSIDDWQTLLAVGSMVAAEARAAVQSETGFRSSAGIAHNKMLAKLVSGLHKPDDQTVVLPDQASDFVAPLPVRALPGVGFKTEKLLTEQLGVSTAAEVRRLNRRQLADKLGDKIGQLLWHLCRGLDPTPVRPTGPPRSITVEDSFKSCTSWPAAAAVLRVLAPDLLQRLHDEYAENRRRAETLTLKWRLRGTGWSRTSASCAMPLPPGAFVAPPTPAQIDQMVRSAIQLLQKQLKEPFNLSLINLGATNFKQAGPGGGSGGGGGTIMDLVGRRSKTIFTAAGTAVVNSLANTSTVAPGGLAGASAPLQQLYDGGLVGKPQGMQVREEGWEEDDGAVEGEGPWPGMMTQMEDEDGGGGPAGNGRRALSPRAAEAAQHARHGQLSPFRPRSPLDGRVAGSVWTGGLGSGLSPEEARRAAEQSAAMRRDYRGSGQGPTGLAVLSKSRERQLREEAARAHLLQPSPGITKAGLPPGHMPSAAPAARQVATATAAHHSSASLPPPTAALVPTGGHPGALGSVTSLPTAGSPPEAGAAGGDYGLAEPRAKRPRLTVADCEPPTSSPLPGSSLAVDGHRLRNPPAADTVGQSRCRLGVQPLPPSGLGQAPVGPQGIQSDVPHGTCHAARVLAGEGFGPPDNAGCRFTGWEACQLETGGDPGGAGFEWPTTRAVSADALDVTAGGADLDSAVLSYRVVELYGDVPYGEDGAEGDVDGAPWGCGCSDGGSSSDGGGIASLPSGWDGYLADPGGQGDGPQVSGLGKPSAHGRRQQQQQEEKEHRVGRQWPPQWQQDDEQHPRGDMDEPLGEGECSECPPQQRPATSQWAPSPAPPTAGPSRPAEQPGPSPPPGLRPSQSAERIQRVILHVDVDCFYCQVERLDDPSLVGKPLAVTQFNSGGFVAVSYEARAAGIRCGDGVGAGGRAAIPYLRSMGAVSLAEAQRRCPGLVVRPMRTDRYRRVAEQVHGLLRRFAPDGQVEKTSYDDFYIDVTAACHRPAGSPGPQVDCRTAAPPPPTTTSGLQDTTAPASRAAVTPPPAAAAAANPTASAAGYAAQDDYDEGLEAWHGRGQDLDLDLDPDQDMDLDPDQGMDPEFDMDFGLGDGAGGAARGGCLGGVSPGFQGNCQTGAGAPPRVHVGGGARWCDVEAPLRRGVEVAQQLRAALQDALPFTVSVGVAPTKLAARLAGPANKPDAITVVPAARLRHFMAPVRIRSVPTLAGKTGAQLVSDLGIELVGQLAGIPRRDLVARFGPQTGAFLAELPNGGPTAGDTSTGGGGGGGGGGGSGAVRERGPQKTLLVERSFPPITRFGGVKEELEPLVGTLWERLVEDALQHRRAPTKLLLTWRQGYGASKTKSADVSVQVLQALRTATAAAAASAPASPAPAAATGRTSALSAPIGSDDTRDRAAGATAGAASSTTAVGSVAATPVGTAALGASTAGAAAPRWTEPGAVPSYAFQGCRALLEGGAAIFKSAVGGQRNALQITRLAIAVGFGVSEGTDGASGQRSISAFTTSKQQLQPHPPPQQQQQRQEQQQRSMAATAAGSKGAGGAASATFAPQPVPQPGVSNPAFLFQPRTKEPSPVDGRAMVGDLGYQQTGGGAAASARHPSRSGAALETTATVKPTAAGLGSGRRLEDGGRAPGQIMEAVREAQRVARAVGEQSEAES